MLKKLARWSFTLNALAFIALAGMLIPVGLYGMYQEQPGLFWGICLVAYVIITVIIGQWGYETRNNRAG